jgi:hypothetical protein
LEQQLATLEQLSTSTAMLDKVWRAVWLFCVMSLRYLYFPV